MKPFPVRIIRNRYQETYQITGKDLVVVIDALRASVSIKAALEAGATEVIPKKSLSEGDLSSGAVVAGEESGEKLSDLEFGNSPTQFLDNRERIKGRQVIIKTTNGTESIRLTNCSYRTYIGSMTNLDALVEVLSEEIQEGKTPERLVFLTAGRQGQPAQEDIHVAELMVNALPSVAPTDESFVKPEEVSVQNFFKNTSTGRHLIDLGYGDDVVFSAQPNQFDLVPVYESGRIIKVS